MVSVTGKSLIYVDFESLEKFLNSLIKPEQVPGLNIKFDGREKVKSVFFKLDGDQLTIYTGAINAYGMDCFSNEVASDTALIVLFILFAVKVYSSGKYDLKTAEAAITKFKAEPAYQQLVGNLNLFYGKLLQLYPNVFIRTLDPIPVASTPKMGSTVTPIATPVAEDAPVVPQKEKKPKLGESPYKGVPLVDTPKLPLSESLDLINA